MHALHGRYSNRRCIRSAAEHLCVVCSLLLAAINLTSQLALAVTFKPLGNLGGPLSIASSVSEDGLVVGGFSDSSNGFRQGFVWTPDSGMVAVAPLPGKPDPNSNYITDVSALSADGRYVAGAGRTPGELLPVRWERNGVGEVLDGIERGMVLGLSHDGSAAVGWDLGSEDGHAVRWTLGEGGPTVDIFPEASIARGVSADGKVVVGDGPHGAMLWRPDSDAPPIYWSAIDYGTGISADGMTAIGWPSSGEATAARWNVTDGLIRLGDLPGGSVSSFAWGVSGDGSVVVGQSNTGSTKPTTFGTAAFIWDESHGMRSLQDVLEDAGIDLPGWYLADARGISPNGRYVVGYGSDPKGNGQAYLIDLGPGSLSGDANGDFHVDLTDFGILKASFGSGGTLAEGDFDGNGQVDLADFGILKANFGTAGGAAAVPEPSGLAMAVISGVLVGLALLACGAKRNWTHGGSDWLRYALARCRPFTAAWLQLRFRREPARTLLQVAALGGLAMAMGSPRASTAAEPLFWFDATDAATVLDSTGKSAKDLANPFPVATWKDRSSNVIDAVQPEDGYRPRFVSDGINGLPSLEFDGADDFFSLLPTLGFHDQMSLFIAVQLDSIDPERREGILSGVTRGGHAAEMWLGGDDGPLLGQTFVSRVFPTTFDDVAGLPMVIGVTYDGAQATFSMNGNVEARPYELRDDEWAPDQYIVGRSPFTSATLHGMMSELVVYDTALDENERAQVELRLLRKYGLAPPRAGDANGDGKVDLADFGILKANFGSGSTLAEGDFDGNGQVDLADFGILKANFGTADGAAAVPEPSGLALALGATLGLIAVAAHRRRGGAARWVG